MSTLPTSPSESFKRLNPKLYPSSAGQLFVEACLETSKPRLRQNSKPVMNKLEQEYFDQLNVRCPNYPRPRAQAVRFKLCNGVNYTPDIFVLSWPQYTGPAMPTAWEVKGKKAWDDAIVKLKMAAHEWPEIKWVLVWKEDNGWKNQEILP